MHNHLRCTVFNSADAERERQRTAIVQMLQMSSMAAELTERAGTAEGSLAPGVAGRRRMSTGPETAWRRATWILPSRHSAFRVDRMWTLTRKGAAAF